MTTGVSVTSGSHACGLRDVLRSYARGPVGLSFFTAWISLAFYADVLWGPGTGRQSDEWRVIVSMLAAAVVSGTCAVCAHRGRVRLRVRARTAWLGAGACGAGALATICLGWLGVTSLAAQVAACVIMASGFVALTMQWGGALACHDDASIELFAPLSFAVGQVVVWLCGLLPAGGTQLATVALPLASAALFGLGARDAGSTEVGNPTRRGEAHTSASTVPQTASYPVRDIAAVTGALFLCRLLYGMARVPTHDARASGLAGLVSLAVALAVFGTFVVMALRTTRSVDIGLAVTWTLPLLLVTMALLATDVPAAGEVARVTNRAASLTMQAFW